jgi:PIN domain nuclease of toxin-antitoxin system
MESGRYEKLDESSEVFGTAVRLYQLGHMDMIDNILYASSVQFGLRFLTVDNKLRDFIEEKHLERTLLLVDNLG